MMKDLNINPGVTVYYKDSEYKICRVLDINTVLAIDVITNDYTRLKISNLTSESKRTDNKDIDLRMVPEDEWKVAQYRFSIIKPIISKLNEPEPIYSNKVHEEGLNLVESAARRAKVNKSTIYRWIHKYESTRLLSSLLPVKGRGGKGKGRLQKEVEAIIESVINNRLLTKQKRNIQTIITEIRYQCKSAGLKVPHSNTIRYRISQLNEKELLKSRYGNKAYNDVYSPKVENYNEASYPLDIVQIDHTKLDIMLVDDELRIPIGRPWITLAIDVYSRMVLGFYISFESPGTLGTGLCISHSILAKDSWLAALEIDGEWPCWGKMKTLHLDNAKEFRGKDLLRSCEQYNISIEWRPVKRPNYGGHIERLLGTVLTQIHQLPGTTFSDIKDRKNYNSEKKAVFSLPEFEKWLTTYIVNKYHRSIHRGIGMRPIDKYNIGIMGDGDTVLGKGIPPRPQDEFSIKLNFLPSIDRTIQDYGVVIDHIFYYSDVLKKWINSTDIVKGKLREKRKFTFKRDPRDISKIYFYDPELEEYFPIPYRNPVYPSVSLWEYRLALKRIKDKGVENYDEGEIFKAIEDLRSIEENSINKTKQAKFKRKRKTPNTDKIKEKTFVDNIITSEDIEYTDIKPFDNIEIDDGTTTFEN